MTKSQKYYSKSGTYLDEHKTYLTVENLKRDADFVVGSLKLNKKDKCLDMQCAQGRLTVELEERGFDVDGVDLSGHMLSLAKKTAKQSNLDINFIKDDLHDLHLPKIYTKVFIYFPDWSGIDLDKVLQSVGRVTKRGGLFLYDHDNLFRFWSYLKENPKEPYSFEPVTMEFCDKNGGTGDRYYNFPELKDRFKKAGFEIVKTYGGWDIKGGEYKYDSQRLRIVAIKE